MELIHGGVPNIVCIQPFGCLPNHIVGKGVIKEVRREHPEANIVAIDYDPGASEVNQLNRIKNMLSTAQKNLHKVDKKTHNSRAGYKYFSKKTNSKLLAAGSLSAVQLFYFKYDSCQTDVFL